MGDGEHPGLTRVDITLLKIESPITSKVFLFGLKFFYNSLVLRFSWLSDSAGPQNHGSLHETVDSPMSP